MNHIKRLARLSVAAAVICAATVPAFSQVAGNGGTAAGSSGSYTAPNSSSTNGPGGAEAQPNNGR
jgi:hypothetical protein